MQNKINNLHPLPDDFIKPQVFPLSVNTERVNPGMHFKKIFHLLRGGEPVCMSGSFGFALAFYSWLKKQNNLRYPIKDYQASRQNRKNFRLLNTNLMIEVSDHQPVLKKTPLNPWLKQFYPEHHNFLMRFSDFLGMNGAWQWFSNGINFQVLDDLVHPFYAVYFPTRYEHLRLFNKWLSNNLGFYRALDIGTGCGLLALMMLQRGIPFVHTTEINPNACYSTKLEIQRRKLQSRVLIEQSGFSGSFIPADNDLIVFNPPWIPGDVVTGLDQATYYEPDFFENFFSHVHGKMKAGTLLVLLFSNFAQAAKITNEHPIEKEIQNKTRFLLVEKHEIPVRQTPSSTKNWLSEIRQREKLELWVLKILNH